MKYELRVTDEHKSQNWRGLVLAYGSIRDREGKFYDTWMFAICCLFEDKDPVKAWIQERGGTWHPIQRFWYIPISATKVRDVLNQFWELTVQAIADLEDVELNIGGGIHINLEAPLNEEHRAKTLQWLQRKARLQNSNLSVVPDRPIPLAQE